MLSDFQQLDTLSLLLRVMVTDSRRAISWGTLNRRSLLLFFDALSCIVLVIHVHVCMYVTCTL